jgi:hypothetical protein
VGKLRIVAHVVGMAKQPESSVMCALAARPNPSIERTSLSWLRQPKAAAHVERWASGASSSVDAPQEV